MDLRNLTASSLALLTTLSIASPLTVMAGDPNYDYLEARYLLDADLDNLDGDGIRFAGSYRFTPQVFGFAEYDTVDLDNVSADFDIFKIGAGFIHPLNTTWNADLSLAYVDAETDSRGLRFDDSGFEISGGVRAMIRPNIGVRASLNYIDIEDDDTYFTLGGDYHFLPNLSAGVEIDLGADYETLSIGARYLF